MDGGQTCRDSNCGCCENHRSEGVMISNGRGGGYWSSYAREDYRTESKSKVKITMTDSELKSLKDSIFNPKAKNTSSISEAATYLRNGQTKPEETVKVGGVVIPRMRSSF